MRSSPLPTVAIDVVRAIFMEAAARGSSIEELCTRFEIPGDQLGDPNARVTVDRIRRLWTELPDAIGAPDFGLDVAQRARVASAFGVVGHVVRAAPTVGEGLRRALRYQGLVSDAIVSEWDERGADVEVVTHARETAFRLPRHAAEFGFASLLLIVREASGRDLRPRHVSFCHARPRDDTTARRIFGCEIEYGASRDRVVFPVADLSVPLQTADSYLAELLRDRADAMLGDLEGIASVALRVRRAVTASLLDAEPAIGAVAARLRSSVRSLQRGLRAEGTTYQRVLDDVRHDLAARHLEEGKLSIQEIAFVLGFSEQSAFHHAFVRWTGRTPSAYRKSVAAAKR